MTLIVLGLLLWTAAHMFKRVAPGARAILTERIGDGSKGIFAVLILGSVVLLVIGYRGAETGLVYVPPAWGVHLNNLLMFFAIALFGLANSKGRARIFFRHPMLLGFATWAVAHLIVNGYTASVVMFGGLLLWALASIVLINMREAAWVRPAPGPIMGDVRLVLITLALYAVVAGTHMWLGVWPFG